MPIEVEIEFFIERQLHGADGLVVAATVEVETGDVVPNVARLQHEGLRFGFHRDELEMKRDVNSERRNVNNLLVRLL